VREFGMAAIMNGVALHGGFIPYGGTFLTFSDYSRNAIRMAALMKQRVIHVFTHDSIGLGEDGPTHQSVEHAASLRLIPNLDVWRPADTTETAVAWSVALSNRDKPTALLLSRQNLPYRPSATWATSRAAPTCCPSPDVGLKKKAQAVIIATGSEVQLALAAQKLLAEKKIAVRVVSMPSTTTFDRQDAKYKKPCCPPAAAHRRRNGRDRLLVEVRLRRRGRHRPLRRIGPGGVLFKHFGFTAENVADTVRAVLAGKK
jgi:transketolase